MPERLWIPADYVDEVCPPGRASPDAWIASPAADVWYIAAPDQDSDPGPVLAVGQIIEFAWVEDLGEVSVELRSDGTHAAQGAVPSGVTHFWFDGEPDTLADSLDEFVAGWREMNVALGESETVLVRMNRWSDEPERFQFDLNERGPRFIRPAPAREVAP